MKAAMQQIKSAQLHNDTISSVKRFAQAIQAANYPVFEIHKRALERGVNTRVIVEKSENKEFPNKRLEKLMEYPNFQLRYVAPPPKALGSCFDNKRIAIIIEPSENIEESPIFCTHHPSFVAIFQQYFETLWKSALPATNNVVKANHF
jgi:hypothetical protein